jgi:hypothetical protein
MPGSNRAGREVFDVKAEDIIQNGGWPRPIFNQPKPDAVAAFIQKMLENAADKRVFTGFGLLMGIAWGKTARSKSSDALVGLKMQREVKHAHDQNPQVDLYLHGSSHIEKRCRVFVRSTSHSSAFMFGRNEAG